MNDKLVETVTKNPWSVPAAIGVLSFGGGLAMGFFIGRRKAKETVIYKFSAQKSDKEGGENDTNPFKVVIEEEAAVEMNIVPPSNLSALRPPVEDSVEEDETEVEEPEVLITVSPGTTEQIEWDYEEEISKRTENAPYVLHQEEFYADEKGYSQITLTFYAIDEIMADEDDTPVYNYNLVTGELLFGHGSGDPNVVYVRNDSLRTEYEIIKLDALYSREVLGLEIENNARVSDLKHSKHHKFRMD